MKKGSALLIFFISIFLGRLFIAYAAITSLNGLNGNTQTFATTSDANILLTISSAGTVHTFSPTWSGILQPARGGTGASTFTTGSILFFQNGAFSQNANNFFWDNSNLRLGIGTSTPTVSLEIKSSADSILKLSR